MSPGGLERFGLTPEDFIGRKREDTAPLGITAEQWRTHQNDIEAHRPFRDLKMCRLDAQKRHRWCSISGWPIFDEEGRFAGYRGTGRDISAEVEAEHRASVAQGRLSAAVEALSDALAFFDADDRLITCNDAYRRLSGPTSHLVVPGVTFEELLRAAAAIRPFPQSLPDQEAFVQERLAYHRNRSARCSARSAQLMDPGSRAAAAGGRLRARRDRRHRDLSASRPSSRKRRDP